jgi:hypothetical protein
MNNDAARNLESNAIKDSILDEIFTAYRQAATAYKKTSNPETRHTLLAIKHCFDLSLKSLLPLDDHHLKHLEEVNAPFAN